MMRNVARSVLLSVLTLALAAIGLATQVGVAFAAPTTCGGVVFHDFDHDGERTEDYSHVSADYAAYQDEGVSGITVLITTVSGATLNATTDAAGAWSANLDTDDFPIRVDFTGLPSGWTSTPKGANSDGLTQHIASDADCGTDGAASAGISAPGSFCDTRPELATTCFLFGNVADHDSQAAVVTLIDGAIDNGGTGGAGWQTDPYTTIATLGQVGAVYGIESNPNDGSVYAASFVKRHTQLGSTDNPTTIYRIDAAGAVAPWFTTDPGATDPHSGATDGWLADHAAFDDVGRSGLGDIEITADGKTLYVVDIGQKELVTIPINSDGTASTGGVTRTAITSSALGAPCVDQDLRPFGLGILDDGSVLISATCTAESTAAGQGPTDPVAGPVLGDPTQLSAAVYEFSGGSFSKVVDVPIPTASRGTQNGGSNFQGVAQWRPWITEPPYATNFVGWPLAGVTYAQPLVSDITQDGDDLIIGIMDIWGHQMGSNAFYLRDGVEYRADQPLSSGDLIRAVSTGTGAFTFPTTGSDYFYTGDNYQSTHAETALGSPVQIPGRPYSITNSFDPINGGSTWQSGGLEWFANENSATLSEGAHVRGYRLYDGRLALERGTFEKAAGIGDVQALCGLAPIEVGDYVWFDADSDGVADPGEQALDGVVIELLDAAGIVIATTTTDANGLYLFDDSIAGFDRGGNYSIRVAQNNYDAGGVFASGGAHDGKGFITQTNAGADDMNDNDGAVVGGLPTISFTATQTDHTMDFGFTTGVYDLALAKLYTSDTFGNPSDGLIENGADVTFMITVTNQGTVDATSFDVTDYVPSGLSLSAAEVAAGTWTDNGDGTVTTTGGPLAAGATANVPITLTANSVSDGTTVNWAEISDDDGDDVDSTPDPNQANDNQPSGPGDATDNTIDNSLDGDGAADEDDHDPAGVDVASYDLALQKVYTSDTSANTTDGAVAPGGDVTFTITVTNQGTLDAASFEVTDYIPAGFVLNDGAWTDNGDGTATISGGALAAGASTDITITLTATTAPTGNHVNWAEISADDGNDIDSTPNANQGDDNQPAGPGAPTDNVIDGTAGDSDDHDPAGVTVEIFDLALIKVFTSDTFENSTDGVLENGADATFTITVTNQGSLAANMFTVTDYLPAGFVLSATSPNNAAWTDNGNGTANFIGGPLAAGASTDITITMTATTAVDGVLVNWAEISADDGPDVDSTPDAVQGNDNQPAGPGDPTDNVIDNTTDGAGAADEDDQDPAGVTVQSYDLALQKVYTSDTFANTTDGVIEQGSDVTFTITITNQGTVGAASFEVTDYIPAGFVLSATSPNNAAWTDNGDGTATTTAGPLAAGATTDIAITMTAASTSVGTFENWAEISADDGNDVDSAPDAVQGNDNQPAGAGEPTDDAIDNTADGNGAADEDDHDVAAVSVANYDLALQKVFTSDTFGDATDGFIENGTDVTFTITVTNQGTLDAATIDVTDYIPIGFVLNDGAWMDNGDGTATFTAGPIAAGTTLDIPITLTANGAADGDYVNWAEISADDGNDVDSTPDAVQGNDTQPDGPGDATDNEINNTPDANIGADEDDHDPAPISVGSYDLALAKVYTSDTFDAPTDGVIDVGADVVFTITVTNQGTIDANTFTVTDYLPAGFALSATSPNNAAWTDNGDGTATTTAGPLAAGASTDITLTMTTGTVAPGTYVNWAEISADDGNDVDSIPDGDVANDNQPSSPGDPTDNVTNNAPDGNGAADEDDHDPAAVGVENFDLALIKTLANDGFGDPTDGLTENGSDVTFTITVTNQGTLDASIFEVTDYLPSGFVLNAASPANAGWSANADGTATISGGPLAAGDSTDITIVLTADAAATGVSVNGAEISADDGNDIDSTPDSDPADDAQPAAPGDPTDDATNNSPDANGVADSDDHDIAGVTIGEFDLALTKVYTSDTSVDGNAADGRAQAGDNVTFTITVTNQGTLEADTFDVTDYIPAGLALNDPAWTANADGTATVSGGPLAPGDSTDMTITLTVISENAGSLVNEAEISSDAATDIDSTPDTDPSNDNQPVAPGDPTDNVTDNSPDGNGDGDEDDHDIAGVVIDVYDLALVKDFTSDTSVDGNSTDGVIQAGDDATFTITVRNEGTVTAATFDITDYYPAGFVLSETSPDNGAWTDNGNNTATTTLGPLAAGESMSAKITLTAETTGAGSLVNQAEISSDDGEDVDSTPNIDPTDDGVALSEDDSDDAPLTVDAYDLALRKVYTSDTEGDPTDGVVDIGSDITFTITVFNQGTVDASNIEVTDYIPAGLTLSSTADTAAWTDNGDGTAVTTIGSIAAGISVDVTITLTAVNPAIGAQLNAAEISGDDGADIDSTPNGDVDDDGPITDNEIDNAAGDEDDHDPAPFSVVDEVVPVFDLALRKRLADGSNVATVAVGDSVTWTIAVVNQGEVIASNINVIDYLPSGLDLADSDWTKNADGTASITIAGPIAPGAAASVDVTTTVVNGTNLTNVAEISSADPVDANGVVLVLADGVTRVPDADSVADAVNAETPVDDVLDNAGGDEDDHDLARVILATTTAKPITPLAVTGATWTLVFLSWALGLLLLGGALVLFARKEQDELAYLERRRRRSSDR